MERPDLDDYRYLATGLPAAAGMVLLFLLRAAGRHPAALGIGLGVGAVVGLALVLVLVVQLYMWKDQIARAVVELGNPRLPVGFTIAAALYFVGVVLSALALPHLLRQRTTADETVLASLALIAGAFLPWALVLWPMEEVRKAADALYRERTKVRFGARRPSARNRNGKS